MHSWANPALQAADLAEKSTDRAVRVSACEFLHASILWVPMHTSDFHKPLFPLRPMHQAPHSAHSVIRRRLCKSIFNLEVHCMD